MINGDIAWYKWYIDSSRIGYLISKNNIYGRLIYYLISPMVKVILLNGIYYLSHISN